MASVSPIVSAASISASNVSQLFTDVAFATTVAGKTYTGDVTFANGVYIADDPNLAGAIATGGTVQSAENSAVSRIDFFA